MKIDDGIALRMTLGSGLLVALGIGYVISQSGSSIAARSPRMRALSQAMQIHGGVAEYAIDGDGNFPVATTHSNAAFAQLSYPKPSDRCYRVPGSAWNERRSDRGSDRYSVIDADVAESGFGQGTNHWAYASGLNTGSKGNLPIVMDGFSETIGVYVDDPKKRGGVWRGEVAVIVRVDGSVKLEQPHPDGRIYEMKSGAPVDIFSADYGADRTQLLNPW